MSNTQTVVTPVERTITVDCPVEHAFETFTARIGDWWPLGFHSISVDEDGKGPPETAVMEGRTGGRIYERNAAGEETEWGWITFWEPPKRLVYQWHIATERESATEVEIAFTDLGGRTRVDIEHRGWERLGERGQTWRNANYVGWDGVLSDYKNACERGA